MRRIKQSVHLSDESLQKLWEMEQKIRTAESDLTYIQKKIEKGKLDKARGKKSKPFKTQYTRDTINEDCLNLSIDNVHALIGAN